ncbi:permease prefix domain 1-containing protein [Alicyclobacillus ferrooxydans]|uniref:Uncharacterized protein n=1 Tax=Alicyclobacillus ferrooxydans TaxID=471514 RepID=A0A0P9CHS0_9BACL|nr:permease prefix domain 1-containing protein [Alicyclobacillus ferrooxydans]KPV42587.1 hypothetical protein AN477_16470 [Alicyclobacillus ferrooxydans]
MKNKIKRHVDGLFSGVYETKQLRELKEEICSNLLDKVNDLITKGSNPDSAFQYAILDLGDMTELVDSLREASETRLMKDQSTPTFIDKNHIIGYLVASFTLLIGLLSGAYVYLQVRHLFVALEYLAPFLLVSAPLFIYFGLTQETKHDYGMNTKRALIYSMASEVFLLGASASAIEYIGRHGLAMTLLTFGPFVIVSAIIFIYLGLTEKSRRKMDSQWQREWVNYYNDPHTAMVRGSISGALWLFSIAAFFFIGFAWGWKYSWIVFVIAVGCEPLIEAYFASKRKH